MLITKMCLSFVFVCMYSFEYHLTIKCKSILLKKKTKFLNHADYNEKMQSSPHFFYKFKRTI